MIWNRSFGFPPDPTSLTKRAHRIPARSFFMVFIPEQMTFARVQKSFAAMQMAFARVQSAFARVQSAFARVQSPFARVQSAFALLQSAFALLQSAFARVQMPVVLLHRMDVRVQNSIVATFIVCWSVFLPVMNFPQFFRTRFSSIRFIGLLLKPLTFSWVKCSN